jgi:NAD(P)-dependent dehydrogenase (short-subunit alcohol dehydrogenase family)
MSGPDRRAILITGAAARIGRALATGLAADGWAVAVHYNGSADEADEVIAEISRSGGKAAAVPADLSDAAETASLVSRASEMVGPLGALVNNASVFLYDDLASMEVETWDLHQAVNLRAPVQLAQAFAAQLPPPGRGAVVNIIDQRVWNLTPHFLSYTASKAGLWAMTRTMALNLAPRIRVNAIGPGPTLPSIHQSEAEFEAQYRAVPLERATSPGEICDAVRFLLAAEAVTGQMIALDGGEHLGWAQADPLAATRN